MSGVHDAGPPVIGITAHRERSRWSHWDRDADILAAAYADAVIEAGGLPVLIPARAGVGGSAVPRLDGILLSGGPDLDPSLYGDRAHPLTIASHPERDSSELSVLATAIANHIPVLAVCRGAQLLNVSAGGTLDQHLPDDDARADHGAVGVFASTAVSITAASRIGALLGSSTNVHCHHHQAVGRLAPGLQAVARADDGTIEAIELERAPFVVGVQWHPEEESSSALFHGLVTAAGERLSARLRQDEDAVLQEVTSS
jgi:gamma-glutamyl-gamma-aminobutyrate hydrolase PuuD